jgi:hypothetical protein
MRAIRLVSLVFFAVMLATAAVSQTVSPAPTATATPAPTAVEKAQWLERANLITAAIQEDASNLPPNLQFVLPGRLGEAWRSVDPKRAQAWLEESVARVTTGSLTETKEEHRARMDAAVAFIRDWSGSNPDLADRLLDSLIAQLPPSSSANMAARQDRQRIGNSISMALAQPGGPDRIFSLGERAIKAGSGMPLPSAYLSLSSQAPGRASQLADEWVRAARENGFDVGLLLGLTNLLRASAANVGHLQKIPEALQAQILQTLFDGLMRVPQTAEDQKNICQLAWMVSPLIGSYEAAQQGPLRVAVDACVKSDPLVANSVRSSETFHQGGTSEELLKQADDTADVHARVGLKMVAADNAANAGDFPRALDIVDGFSKDERADTDWPNLWHSVGFRAIRALYDKHDLQGIQQVIARAPDQVRAMLTLQAAGYGLAKKDTAYGLMMAAQAAHDLDKSPVTTDYRPYETLMAVYGRNIPDQALLALRMAVNGINNFKPEPDEAKVRIRPLGANLTPESIPSGLLDADPPAVEAAIAGLKSPQARTSFRLGLLKGCLARYQGPAQPPAPKKESKPPSPPTLKTDATPAADDKKK